MTEGEPQHLAVIVPVYNEEDGLGAFHERLIGVLDRLDLTTSVLYVDDGSSDGTVSVVEGLASDDGRVGCLQLSRNFGKELALTAGLDHVDADAVVIIDADLQDPPELIVDFVREWRAGHDVVYGTRRNRAGDNWLKRLTAAGFYRLMERLSDTPIPRDTGDYRLLSRRVVDVLRGIRERHRFMKGLYAWVGYRQTSVLFSREPRHQGSTKYNYRRLWYHALDGITSFSAAPLRFATWLGLAVAGIAFVYGAWLVGATLIYGNPVPGYPSLMVVILFLGGVQLVALGIIGEYLARLSDEAKHRPLYLIERHRPGQARRVDVSVDRDGS